ncbi:MAG: O-antigen ligase family protein [Gaiellales bacterium]|nr:O-antigen ligase family protein [Gaiellales bacterium]
MSGHKAVQGSGAARRWELLAGLLAGAIILIAGLGYSRAVYALYFTPRVVAIYPLAILLVAVWLVKDRLGVRRLSLDPLDGLAVLFSLWQIVVTIISPSSNLAWYGVLNRGGGALLWVTAALLFMVARRALASREALIPFALCCAALLALAGLASVLQLAGAEPPWGGVGTYLEQGRMTGTAGNPVNLAGLALLTIWTGGLVLMRQDLGRAVGVALGVASLLGLAALILAVSRAGYLSWGLGVVVLLVALWLTRERRRATLVAAILALVAVSVVLYNPRGSELAPVAGEAQQEATGETEGSALSESDQSRVEFWRIGLKALASRPLTGYGQGAYVVAYREHVAPGTIIERPNVAVSDPHQLELLLASGSGVPGLLLGLALLLSPVVLLLLRFARGGPTPAANTGASATRRAAASPPGGRWMPAAVPGLAYVVTALAFLQVSPLDFVVLLPLVLIGGGSLGAPPPGGRLVWTMQPRREARLVWPAAEVGCAAFLVLAVVMGARFYSADTAFAASVRGDGSHRAVEAFHLVPNVPEYAQVAGGSLWREGVADQKEAEVEEGTAILEHGLQADPQGITLYAELARLYVTTGRAEEAAAACRDGLRHSPHYPVLQGLWAYAGLVAVEKPEETEVAVTIAADLRALPVDTPDGWYWLSRLQQALGQTEAAAESAGRSTALSPELTADDYQRRLESGS